MTPTPLITVMLNANGSWALLARVPDSPAIRRALGQHCAAIHSLTLRHTHFKLVDANGKLVATLRDGANAFRPVEG